MLLFSGVMLLLLLLAYFRGPRFRYTSSLWFALSWLPSELPWLFAFIQTVVIVSFAFIAKDINLLDVAGIILSLVTLYFWLRLHRLTFIAGHTFQQALRASLGENYEKELPTNIGISSPPVIQKREWLLPLSFKRPGVEWLRNIAYGKLSRQQLDIYRSNEHTRESPDIKKQSGIETKKSARPVLLHIHGGAWMFGHKNQQGQPLLHYLAQNGWICVDINYRRAPQHRLPDSVIDVKTAIVWLKKNIAAYGGDPDFIAVTGGSAGGHLCSLAALTANQPEFQPGFEEKDTRVQAAVPVYGMYDFTNGARDGKTMQRVLGKLVMPAHFSEDPDFWKSVSPLHRVTENAPPMFVSHGDTDCVVAVEQARDFVQALREKNNTPVVYAELIGAQHAYDVFHSVRTEYHLESVGKFLHHCYAKALADKSA